jgi:hypothetical protein
LSLAKPDDGARVYLGFSPWLAHVLDGAWFDVDNVRRMHMFTVAFKKYITLLIWWVLPWVHKTFAALSKK